MKILGIETSTRTAGLAVAEGEKVAAETVLPREKSNSASLIPGLDRMLKEAHIQLGELRGIAVGIGPGSFTGIRLGLATARGLSLALGIPVRGVGVFDLLLADYRGDAERICPLIDAHSYGCYSALYEKAGGGYRRAREPMVCRPEELANKIEGDIFFLGPHVGKFRSDLKKLFGARASFDAEDRFPSAATAARLYDNPRAVHDDPPGSVGPLYILPGVRVKSVDRTPR